MRKLLLSVLMLAATLASPAFAEGLLPSIPEAMGEPHPEGNEYWRINHPALLNHSRDATVIEGIRPVDASIKACVACHAVEGPDAAPVTYNDSPEHICRVCHDYVAVKIDCFQCHNSRPEEADWSAVLPSLGATPETLAAYLERISQ